MEDSRRANNDVVQIGPGFEPGQKEGAELWHSRYFFTRLLRKCARQGPEFPMVGACARDRYRQYLVLDFDRAAAIEAQNLVFLCLPEFAARANCIAKLRAPPRKAIHY